MDISLSFMLEIVPELIKYIPLTLYMAVVAMLFSVVLGLILAFIRNSKIPVLYQLAGVYISFFRAIPMLVELFLIYYGLPQIFPALTTMGAITAAIIGFSLKEAAYLSEIFRAALNSVDKGQLEASISVGMTKIQAYRRIVLPQAAVNALPATGNQFISLIKNTSLAFTLGVTELFAQGKMMASASMRFLEAYLVVAVVYWVLIIVYSYLQRLLEERLSRPYRT